MLRCDKDGFSSVGDSCCHRDCTFVDRARLISFSIFGATCGICSLSIHYKPVQTPTFHDIKESPMPKHACNRLEGGILVLQPKTPVNRCPPGRWPPRNRHFLAPDALPIGQKSSSSASWSPQRSRAPCLDRVVWATFQSAYWCPSSPQRARCLLETDFIKLQKTTPKLDTSKWSFC